MHDFQTENWSKPRKVVLHTNAFRPPAAYTSKSGSPAGAAASRGRAVDEEVAVRQDIVLEGDDGARVAGAVAEDARSASAAQLAGALASATVGDARALPYDDASADALVMLGQLYHLIEAGDLPAAGRRKSTRSSLSGRIRVARAPSAGSSSCTATRSPVRQSPSLVLTTAQGQDRCRQRRRVLSGLLLCDRCCCLFAMAYQPYPPREHRHHDDDDESDQKQLDCHGRSMFL